MIHFCCFVLLVAASLSDARPHMCEQRERSLADLDLAEDALSRAKLLVPNCEEDESSNSTECSKKEKSIGFIDVALDLVSNAKKNIPICPHIPTEIPLTTTEDFSTATEEISPTTEDFSTATEDISHTTEDFSTATEDISTTTEDFSTATEDISTTNKEPIFATDCQELQEAGIRTSGVYQIWPQNGDRPIQVRCDMDTDGGGWTVFQRRGNFSIQENFERNWNDYKTGFGSLERDFWLGNDNLFALSNQGNYSLRMDMTAVGGESAFAVYRTFRVADETHNYQLTLAGYDKNGTAGGDGMTHSSDTMFSTKDRKNSSRNCAVLRKGGFWYYDCANCNPNGLYKPGVDHDTSMWYYYFKNGVGLFSMDMKLKRL